MGLGLGLDIWWPLQGSNIRPKIISENGDFVVSEGNNDLVPE